MTDQVSPTKHDFSLRYNAILRIARQQVHDTLLGWGFYVTASAAVLIAVILVYNSVRFVEDSGLNIMQRPFFLPLQIAASIGVLYVTIEATLAVARPREQGSLQVLFFAPIDVPTFIGANLLAGLAIYIIFLAIILPPLLLLVWITNFVMPFALLWGLLPTIFVAGAGVAFGLFISAAAPSVRSAILLLVAALLVLLLVQGGYAALLSIPPTNRFYDALQFLRVFLGGIQGLLLWISPFQMLDAMLDAALRVDVIGVVKQAGMAVMVSIFWLVAAVWVLRRKGVLP